MGSRGALGVTALAGVLVAAPAAGADVLAGTATLRDDLTLGFVLTVHAPDGSVRTLAPVARTTRDALTEPVPSPDRSTIAYATGTRIVLVPTAGGPARVVGAEGKAGLQAIDRGASPWWSGDGSGVSTGTVLQGGRSALRVCDVATGVCRTRVGAGAAARAEVIGATVDGRAILGSRIPTAVSRARRLPGFGSTTTPGRIARVRAQLNRPVQDLLAVTGRTGGGPVHTWTRTTTPRRGFDLLTASEPGPTGTIVRATRVQELLRTRRARDGGTVAEVDERVRSERIYRIAPDGTRHSVLPPSSTRPGFRRIVPAGPGRWLAWSDGAGTRSDIRLLQDDGTLRPVTVGGRVVSAAGLGAALGRPAAEQPMSRTLGVVGYEHATDSAVLRYQTRDGHQMISRVPLSGSVPPSLVLRLAPRAIVQVTSW